MKKAQSFVTCIAIFCFLLPSAMDAVKLNAAASPGQPEAPGVAPVNVATSSALPYVLFVSRKSNDNQWWQPVYSLDRGEHFLSLATIPYTRTVQTMEVAIIPRLDNTIRFMIITQEGKQVNIYRTGDFGQLWSKQTISNASSLHAMAVSPADPQRLYLSLGDDTTSTSQLYTSADAGVTWETAASFNDPYISEIIPSPALPERLYLYQAGSLPGLQDRNMAGWYQSDRYGYEAEPTNFPVAELAIDGRDQRWLYGLANGLSGASSGYSSDGGTTWLPFASLPCEYGKLFTHPARTGVVFILCTQGLISDGLYRSANYGAVWEKLTTASDGRLFANSGTPGDLLWAKKDGLWHSTNNGASWIKYDALDEFKDFALYLPLARKRRNFSQ